ncbi:MAG: glycosyltransferase family 2 protein [Muribaculaceae bacterium]|nr:glycosyltransferase family 2 protein [Muribaculaceae bacterium]
MSKLISVIIPVYNTSRYLPQCLESVLGQDYQDLEIILVNDKSPDNSVEICKRYAESDKRIKIVDKERNEGLELARFSGFSVASGGYVLHIDSDDWLGNRHVISTMYAKAEETGADYVEIDSTRNYDRFGLIKNRSKNRIIGLIEQPELFEKYFISFFGINILSVWMCGKLYRKSFLDSVEIKPFGVTMGEDLAYNMQLFPYLNKIYLLPEDGYCYRYGGMTSKYNPHLLTDLKKLYRYKEEMIARFKYEKAHNPIRWELKNLLKSEIQQRIRYKQGREEIISYLKEEIEDPVYNGLKDVDKSSSFWQDPFVISFFEKDVNQMYEICLHNEKRNKWKRMLFGRLIKLLSKI